MVIKKHSDDSDASSKSANSETTKSTRKSFLSILQKIAFVLHLISAIIVVGLLFYLSILPLKYFLIVLAAIITITGIFTFFTFKKSFKKLVKILCIVFEFIFIIVYGLIFFYLANTMGFFDSIKAANYQIEEYYILVHKDSEFETLEDLVDHSIALYDDPSTNYQTALEELQTKVTLKAINYNDLSEAVKALVQNSADSFFVKGSLTSIISEFFPEFDMENFRILDTIKIKIEIDNKATQNLDITKDSFNILISGIDTYGDITTISRSDVNMILTINPRTHTILLTSVPRDYEVQLHGTTGIKDKLTHSGLYGINMTVDTIEDLLGINIDYYLRINFDSTIALIDAIGGVEITPDVTFTRSIKDRYCYYYEGTPNHLDGLCALRYARERKIYGLGDLHRIQNQQDVITAIINKLTSSKTILTNYTNILSSLSGSIETNVPSEQIYRFINMQLDSMPSWTLDRVTVNGPEIHVPTYTIPDQILFVFQQDPDSILAASIKIHEVLEAN